MARAYRSGREWVDDGSFRRNHAYHPVEPLIYQQAGVEDGLETEIDRRHKVGVGNIFPRRKLRPAFGAVKLDAVLGYGQGDGEPDRLIVDPILVNPIDATILSGPQIGPDRGTGTTFGRIQH